jgi:hypothetical protein
VKFGAACFVGIPFLGVSAFEQQLDFGARFTIQGR